MVKVSRTNKYDDEPAKPLILAASKNPDNHEESKGEESPTVGSSKDNASLKPLPEPNDDSLSIAEKELDLKMSNSMSKSSPPMKHSEKKKAASIQPSHEPATNQYDQEEEEKTKVVEFYDSDEMNYTNSHYSATVSTVAKNKKAKKFIVNTRHCRQERETLQYVIDL